MAPTKETTHTPLPPRPLISVIIPAYNLGAFVGDTVASVLNTRYDPLEIIVVDDESTDNTPEVLQAYREQGLIQYYRITNNGLAGPSGAINAGLKKATGHLVQCLDADDCVEPGYYEAVCDTLATNPDIDGVCTHATVIDQHNQPISTLKSGQFNSPEEFRLQSLAGNLVISSSMIVKRACYEVVGGRRPRFQICCDYDMWLRIGERFNLHVIPQPLVRYRRHQNNISTDLERMRGFDQDLLNHYIQRNPIEFFIPTPLKTNPDAVDRHLSNLASLMEKRQFPQLAEPFLAALLRRSPKNTDVCQRLSQVHYHSGATGKAQHYASRALEWEPSNTAAQAMLHDLTPLAYRGRQPHHTLSVLLVTDRFSGDLQHATDGDLYTRDLARSLASAGVHVAVLHSLYDSQSVEEFG
ncbi:MAG: glycosyltransferase, partial [Myxococcota bacterium]|nr:glycosyltransferase [Myxococcota bacterium]